MCGTAVGDRGEYSQHWCCPGTQCCQGIVLFHLFSFFCSEKEASDLKLSFALFFGKMLERAVDAAVAQYGHRPAHGQKTAYVSPNDLSQPGSGDTAVAFVVGDRVCVGIGT